MDIKIIDNVIDLILENEVIGIEKIREQRKYLVINKAEIYGNNKYIIFTFSKEVGKVDTSFFGTISVMFWDLTSNIPIDCILHFKQGYIYSLEIYSCDGQPFEEINMQNIDIKVVLPKNEQNL